MAKGNSQSTYVALSPLATLIDQLINADLVLINLGMSRNQLAGQLQHVTSCVRVAIHAAKQSCIYSVLS
jgi:hypothetical protein